VAKNLIFSDEEAAFLKELVKRNVNFIIVGLSAAALQGAPIVTQDIDLWFQNLSDPGIKIALKKAGGIFVPSIGLNPATFAGENVKLFDIVTTMHGLDSFENEIQNTIDLPLGKTYIKILRLERIIKSKEAAGREKDKIVLPVLKDALMTIKKLENFQE